MKKALTKLSFVAETCGAKVLLNSLQLDKYRKGKRTLTVTSAHYGIQIGENAHDAEADCVAAGKLAFKLLGGAALGGLTLTYIHERQIVYAAEQAAGLQAYFRKKDPSVTIDGAWPIRGGK